MTIDQNVADHYDNVAAAWRLLLGDELHYGVFDTGDESLGVATAALTERMVEAVQLTPGAVVLDIGCGSGAPACALATRFAVQVVGITTSEVGVREATARAATAGLDSVSFEQRDGTDNGFPDATFDRVWVLESSHLMRKRELLIEECARVLRPGGRMALCDIIRRREIPFREVRTRSADFATLRTAFGDAHMESLEVYASLADAAGLVVERVDDLTQATLPTFSRWRANAVTFRDEVLQLLGADGLAAFERSTYILEEFWRDGTLGYGLLAAVRPAT